jgi:hypothetical protein
MSSSWCADATVRGLDQKSLFAWTMLLLSVPNSMEGIHQIKLDDVSTPGSILDSCEDLRRHRREGTEEAHNVLEAIRHSTKLLDRIKVCLQGILQLEQKDLRTKFRHLSPEQKSTRVFP